MRCAESVLRGPSLLSSITEGEEMRRENCGVHGARLCRLSIALLLVGCFCTGCSAAQTSDESAVSPEQQTEEPAQQEADNQEPVEANDAEQDSPSNVADNVSEESETAKKSEGASFSEVSLSDLPEDAVLGLDEAQAFLTDGVKVYDLRNRYEFGDAHIPGAKNVAAGKAFQLQIERTPAESVLLIVSKGDHKLAESWNTAVGAGLAPENVKVLGDGMEAWIEAGLPIETTPVSGC